MAKRDNQTNHPNNYILELRTPTGTVSRLIINAGDSLAALRIGINKYCRLYHNKDITRARIVDTLPAGEKRVVV